MKTHFSLLLKLSSPFTACLEVSGVSHDLHANERWERERALFSCDPCDVKSSWRWFYTSVLISKRLWPQSPPSWTSFLRCQPQWARGIFTSNVSRDQTHETKTRVSIWRRGWMLKSFGLDLAFVRGSFANSSERNISQYQWKVHEGRTRFNECKHQFHR